MNAVNNKIDYKKYYKLYLSKHPGYAKRALGFMPEGPDEIKIYLNDGDYIIHNFITQRSAHHKKQVETPEDYINRSRKRGRPKLSEPRDARITLRLTAREFDKIYRRANDAFISPADFIRQMIQDLDD